MTQVTRITTRFDSKAWEQDFLRQENALLLSHIKCHASMNIFTGFFLLKGKQTCWSPFPSSSSLSLSSGSSSGCERREEKQHHIKVTGRPSSRNSMEIKHHTHQPQGSLIKSKLSCHVPSKDRFGQCHLMLERKKTFLNTFPDSSPSLRSFIRQGIRTRPLGYFVCVLWTHFFPTTSVISHTVVFIHCMFACLLLC